jgi:hypothetical protein
VNEPAALTITVCPEPREKYGDRFLLIERGGRSEAFGTLPDFSWLASRRARLAEQLLDVRRTLGNASGIDPVAGGAALHQLFRIGIRWVATLLGEDAVRTSRLLSFIRFVRRLVPDWAQRDRTLRIEVRHSERGTKFAAVIPFEILPLFDLTEMNQPRTKAELVIAALRFLGMAGVVARQPRTRVPAVFIVKRDSASGRVPVRAYCDWSLPGVADEIALFSDLNLDFDLPATEIWPTVQQKPNAAAGELVRRLFGHPAAGGTPTQIHHFACHFGLSGSTTYEEEFTFSSTPPLPTGPIRVSRGDVDVEQVLRAARGEEVSWEEDGPIVVLNACNTGALRLLEEKPLVWWLLGTGHRAVLATETRVPDKLAARFSRFLYGHFGNGVPLGDAVRRARWEMLEKLNNPVGLFFTLYGRPELHLPRTPGTG